MKVLLLAGGYGTRLSAKTDVRPKLMVDIGGKPILWHIMQLYSHFGFNLKVSDMQAAIGVAQLEKFPTFVEKRKENFTKLYEGLKGIDELVLNSATPNSDPSWFGFMITLKGGVKFTRNELVEHLENSNIQTRNLFAGNMLRHPMFDSMVNGTDYRVIGELPNTDKIMNDSFWISLYPGMGDNAIGYMIKHIQAFTR